jgi:hypothetical protein
MGNPFARTLGRRARLALLVAAIAAAAAAALWAPALTLAPLAAAAAVALWDRAALDRELRALAAAVAADGPEGKLEVTDGAWGELCHALNRLQQQRRARQQVEPMLPALPVVRAARLADAGLPPEGMLCEVAVLALAPAGAGAAGVAQLRETAQRALRQAQAHEALMARADEQILLIFGALHPQSPAASLRAAGEAARELQRGWDDGRLRMGLAAGMARAVVLPGLGLSVIGGPVEQALGLRGLGGRAPLLCNEDAYLGLRRIGVIAPQIASPRLFAPDQRPIYAVTL